MEASVLLGRDFKLAYQSAKSALLRPFPIGMPVIGETLVLPNEELRDAIFAGKNVSFAEEPLNPEWGLDRLVTRDYRPLRDDAGKIIGVVSIGFSHARACPRGLAELRAIVSLLESPVFPSELSSGSPLLASCLGASAGSLQLAQRLRRLLPPLLH